MATVTEDPDAYQSLEAIRERVDYRGEELFDDNTELRFDELLVRLEEESRGIIETLVGDEPFTEETDRIDEFRATDDAAMLLVYPVNDVTTVEIKRGAASDWDELESDRWDFTPHRLVLESRPRAVRHTVHVRRNLLADTARRATWRDLCTKVKVTYDRGWDPVPADVRSVQVLIINRQIRKLRNEQSFAAASPDEFAGVSPQFDDVVTEEIRERIADVTRLGGATMSV